MDVREGSQGELDKMLGRDGADIPSDPRVDRALKLMRGSPEEGPVTEKTDNVTPLVQRKTVEELAAEHKAAMRVAAERVCEILTVARRDGIVLSWQFGWDPVGRAFVQSVDAVKPL